MSLLSLTSQILTTPSDPPMAKCFPAGSNSICKMSLEWRIGGMAVERPHFVAAIGHLAPQGLIPVAGGVIVVDGSGLAIGAVGVSGDTSDNDEVCALAGIAAAGLKAQG